MTTHAGSLIRPPDLLPYLPSGAGGADDEAAYASRRSASRSTTSSSSQIEVGLDVVDDGEIGKASWITYLYERVSGLEAAAETLRASMLPPSRDRQAFPGAYAR